MKCSSLFLVIFFILMSTLFYINIATLGFLLVMFSLDVIFNHLTFKLCFCI